MGRPQTREQTLAQRELTETILDQHTYGVVGPEGQVTTHVCLPLEHERSLAGGTCRKGRTLLIHVNGQAQVQEWAAKRGHVFIETLYDADEQGKLTLWREIVCARRRGHKVTASCGDFYSRRIIALRAQATAIKAQGFVAIDGKLVRADTLSEDRRREIVARALGARPEKAKPTSGAEEAERAFAKRKRVGDAVRGRPATAAKILATDAADREKEQGQ
jgi:hypothetical protein